MGFDPEKPPQSPRLRTRARGIRAFTLVELLIVIAILAILASVIVAYMIPKAQQAALHTATAELRQIETAIDSYHADFGTYPPDQQTNMSPTFTTWGFPRTTFLPPLFYELSGAVANVDAQGVFNRTYGTNQTYVTQADYISVFGQGLAGPQNSSAANLHSYLKDLRPTQYKWLPGTQVYVLTCSLGTTPASTDSTSLNPWSYNSSSPTYNPTGFDLFNTNILIGNKYYTIGNWNR